MPDSTDYREAAVLLNRTADDVRAINGPIEAAFGAEVLSGGSLGDSVEQFIADAGATANAIAADLEELSTEASSLAAAAEEQEAAEVALAVSLGIMSA